MVDLSIHCAGIKSPNPFWLASAPPTNTGDQVMRAFDAGWGGAVWKTLGEQIVNVTSRFGGLDVAGQRMVGFNNIELITDRPLAVNLAEITKVKKRYPHHALVVSLMVETKEEWRDLIARSQDTGCDGLELNFGCPHGMCERGMGSAVGQEPEVLEEIVCWVKEYAKIPVLVKLTPNISDIRVPGRAAARAKADGISLINTIKSLMGVDLDRWVPQPVVGGRSTNGGYCGPAVKPIALHMVAQLAKDPGVGIPISGIGGITNWRDAAEFMALGASSVQVCTAVMHHGFRIVEDMIDGLSAYLVDKKLDSAMELVGRALPAFGEWGELDLNHKVIARISVDKCIGCDVCHVACKDGSHDCIHFHPAGSVELAAQAAQLQTRRNAPPAARVPFVAQDECTGCNLCSLVCPVPGCITMEDVTVHRERETWNDRVVKHGGSQAAVAASPKMWKEKHF